MVTVLVVGLGMAMPQLVCTNNGSKNNSSSKSIGRIRNCSTRRSGAQR